MTGIVLALVPASPVLLAVVDSAAVLAPGVVQFIGAVVGGAVGAFGVNRRAVQRAADLAVIRHAEACPGRAAFSRGLEG